MASSTARAAVPATVLVLLSGPVAGCAPGAGHDDTPTAVPAPTASLDGGTTALAGIERRYHARLGVYAVDTGTRRTVAYRADERFAYCSTFKALAAGALLRRSTQAQLDHVVGYDRSDVVDNSPVTSRHVGTGLPLRDLVAAALDQSDNTAANLIVDRLGGPAGFQKALRDLGDRTTHVDREEPALNEAAPGDVRDTSTPRALGTDLRRYVLGDVLAESRRRQLRDWLVANTTGAPYIRAGVPADWKVGDKTGSGGYGTRNDIAIAWPSDGSPIVVAVLSDRGVEDASADDALIADATRAALTALHRAP